MKDQELSLLIQKITDLVLQKPEKAATIIAAWLRLSASKKPTRSKKKSA